MAEKKSFVLRINTELWDALQAAASEDFRSVNGEIEFILTDYLRKRGRLNSAVVASHGADEDSV
jgi:hypothetical protein